MEDISEKLAEILNDPESLNRVRAMAEGILGEKSAEQTTPNLNGALDGAGIDPALLSKIMSVMSKFKTNQNDNRASLLLALKPHLSPPRREKVDTAIKLLKIIELLPFLKDSGIFEF